MAHYQCDDRSAGYGHRNAIVTPVNLAIPIERGLKVDYRTMWEFVHAEKLSYKKRR